MRVLALTSIFLLTSFFRLANAQEEEFARVGTNEPFYVDEVEELENKPDEVPEYFRHFKKLSDVYEGYLVELLVVDFPVSRSHPLLSKFGRIYYELNEEEENYHYFLLIPFEEKRISVDFYKSVIKPQAPDSNLLFREMKKKNSGCNCFGKF